MAIFMKVHMHPWNIMCSSKPLSSPPRLVYLLGSGHFMPQKAERHQEAYL